MNKELKRLQKIVKTIQAASASDISRGILAGMFYEKYENAEHGFSASITATDGYNLNSYYLTNKEHEIFKKSILPTLFNNNCDVLFIDSEKAIEQRQCPYPDYRKVLPVHKLNCDIPRYFEVNTQKIAIDFMNAVTGERKKHYIPNISGFSNEKKQSSKSVTAVLSGNFIALVMPIRVPEESNIPPQKLIKVS